MKTATRWIRAPALALAALLLVGDQAPVCAQEAAVEEHEASSSWFRVGSWRTWVFRSFMRDEGDDAGTLGLELESYLTFGNTQIKNIAYLEVADHPRAIPGQPQGNPVPEPGAATGISDLLTGFWFSKKGEHHGKHHFAPGLAAQFPTASDATLGSGKWSLGPSFDYEYESGSWFAGAIALQIWSVGGDPDRADVSMLMIKPFVFFSLAKNWDLLYVPYGITVYWNKPSGEKVYLPLGGGVQRSFTFGSTQLNLAAQLFKNVVRPKKGTVYDLRFLVELSF